MSTMTSADRPGHIPADTIREWGATAKAAADHALAGAHKLVDKSPARQAAVEFRATVEQSAALYDEALDRLDRAERDHDTRPEVIREQWREYTEDFNTRAKKALRALSFENKEALEETLLAEALPVSQDPAAALLARQEIELALELAGRNNRSASTTLIDLSTRGGEVSAALASSWGRLRYESASKGTDGYELVRRNAVDTVLASDDEARKRAANVYKAANETRPNGGRGTALYEAMIVAQHVVGNAEKLVKQGPAIK